MRKNLPNSECTNLKYFINCVIGEETKFFWYHSVPRSIKRYLGAVKETFKTNCWAIFYIK